MPNTGWSPFIRIEYLGRVMATITTNGIETYYEQRESRSPVVFIHGAIVDHRHVLPQVDAVWTPWCHGNLHQHQLGQ